MRNRLAALLLALCLAAALLPSPVRADEPADPTDLFQIDYDSDAIWSSGSTSSGSAICLMTQSANASLDGLKSTEIAITLGGSSYERKKYSLSISNPGFSGELVKVTAATLTAEDGAAAGRHTIKVESKNTVGRAYVDLLQGDRQLAQFEFLIWNSSAVTGLTIAPASLTLEPGPPYSDLDSPTSGALTAAVTTNPASNFYVSDWGASASSGRIAAFSEPSDADPNTVSFTAVSPGAFRNIAKAGNLTFPYAVAVSGLTLPATASLAAYNSLTLDPERFGNATGDLTWTLVDSGAGDGLLVIALDDGVLTAAPPEGWEGAAALPGRTVTVKCSCSYTPEGETTPIQYTASCSVTVQGLAAGAAPPTPASPGEVTGISISPVEELICDPNSEHIFTAFLVPDTADSPVTWNLVSGEGIVQITPSAEKDDNGRQYATVKALAPGEAQISATAGGRTSETRSIIVSGIVIDKSELTDGVLRLSADDGSAEKLEFSTYGQADPNHMDRNSWEWSLASSADAQYVRVSPSGSITGVAATPEGRTVTVICQQGSYSDTVQVKVLENLATAIEGEAKNDVFSMKDVMDALKKMCTDQETELEYVTDLSVSPSQGTLYYGYVSSNSTGSGVAAADKFYIDGKAEHKQLDRVTFVPRSGFYGRATIQYTLQPKGLAVVSGTILVTVPAPTRIRYVSENGEAVRFRAEDFSAYARAFHGQSVSSVRFDLPDSRYGWLYANYSGGEIFGGNVSADTRFYVTSTPGIDTVSFVPRQGYAGTFTFTCSCSDTGGEIFPATIEIKVMSASGEGAGDLRCTAYVDERFYFSLNDFSALAQSAGLGTLDYVTFQSLPDPKQGKLYVDSSTRAAAADTPYYYTSAHHANEFLGSVNLLPAAMGTIKLPFTAYDTAGKSVGGTIVITVLSDSGRAALINYQSSGMPVTFRRGDFADACREALPAAVASVRFDLPFADEGKLYSSFQGLQNKVPLSSQADVRAADLIKVTFLPRGGTEGAVYISYTATDVKGNSCSGSVRINVTASTTSLYFNDLGSYPWAVSSLDFMRRYGAITGTTEITYSPGVAIRRGDFVLMLCQAFGYPGSGTSSFSDVPPTSYYAGAIAAAKARGIVSGGSELFHPTASLSLQDAAVLIYRALLYEGIISRTNSTALLSRFTDSDQIEDYAQEAVAAMIELGVFRGDNLGRLRPNDPVTRVSMAVILHRAIT